MSFENICKFNPYRSSDLICEQFIYETKNSIQSIGAPDKYIIYLVTDGEGELNVGGESYAIKRGDLFFAMCDDEAIIVSRDSLKFCYIIFRGRRAGEYIERCGVNRANRIFHGKDRLIDFWLDCISMAGDENIDMLSESVLLYSLAEFPTHVKETDDIVSKMISLTHENFKDVELSLNGVAERLGYDPKYLSSVFKKKQGISYTQFLREMRIRHAIFLMEEGVISVKNVALLSGFGDALYFSKVFTKVEGITPKAYIAKIGGQKESPNVDI